MLPRLCEMKRLGFFHPWCPFAYTLSASELPHLASWKANPGRFRPLIPDRLQVYKADLLLLPLRELTSSPCIQGFRPCVCSAMCVWESLMCVKQSARERDSYRFLHLAPNFLFQYLLIINQQLIVFLLQSFNIPSSYFLFLNLSLQKMRAQARLTTVRGAMLSAPRPQRLVPTTGTWVRSPQLPRRSAPPCSRRSCMVPCPTWLTIPCHTEALCSPWTPAMAT